MNPCQAWLLPKDSIFRLLYATLLGLMFPVVLPAQTVHLTVARGYLSHAPVLARVELRNAAGHRDIDRWDADAILSIDEPGITVSPSQIRVRNGLGSALLRITGSGHCTLRATVGDEQDSKSITHLANSPITAYGGTLPGSATSWSGVVLITNDLTVPPGHTLTIEPNTLVLLNGVPSGTTAADIIVQGNVQSLGSETHPVQITCVSNHLNWGQIRHTTAQPSLYRQTFITKGGRATAEGHTGSGPMVRPTSSRIVFESCVISDATTASGTTSGKIMQATGSDLTFDNCILARARMGPEITSTALLCTNTWINEMTGPDDADGIYLHDAPGRQLLMTHCAIGPGNDDAIDLLDAVVDIENCIVRDWPNPSEDAKGISAFGGITRLKWCLFANCYVSVAAKSRGAQALVTINNCTITGILRGVSAVFKDNAQVGDIDFRLTNCIVRSADAIHSDFAPTNFSSITYCNLSEPWAGAGNTTTDPLFINQAASDYHLQPFSPCIDSGHPQSALDPDGSPADRGCFRFRPWPQLAGLQRLSNGSVEFSLLSYTNRNYVIQYSPDFVEWNDLLTIWQSGPSMPAVDAPPLGATHRFYRARLAP